MNAKIEFLAHQVMMGVISIDDIPKKYKTKVRNFIEKEENKEN